MEQPASSVSWVGGTRPLDKTGGYIGLHTLKHSEYSLQITASYRVSSKNWWEKKGREKRIRRLLKHGTLCASTGQCNYPSGRLLSYEPPQKSHNRLMFCPWLYQPLHCCLNNETICSFFFFPPSLKWQSKGTSQKPNMSEWVLDWRQKTGQLNTKNLTILVNIIRHRR